MQSKATLLREATLQASIFAGVLNPILYSTFSQIESHAGRSNQSQNMRGENSQLTDDEAVAKALQVSVSFTRVHDESIHIQRTSKPKKIYSDTNVNADRNF